MRGYKNYTIKKYEKGGLVETKTYKDGKLVVAMAPVTKDSLESLEMGAPEFEKKYGEEELRTLVETIRKTGAAKNKDGSIIKETGGQEYLRKKDSKAKDAKPK